MKEDFLCFYRLTTLTTINFFTFSSKKAFKGKDINISQIIIVLCYNGKRDQNISHVILVLVKLKVTNCMQYNDEFYCT